MTLETCIEALSQVLDKTVTYDGKRVIIEFDSHSEAVIDMLNARHVLAEMKAVAEAGVK